MIYEVTTRDEFGKRTKWKRIDRDHVPYGVCLILAGPTTNHSVTIYTTDNQTATYRKGNQ